MKHWQQKYNEFFFCSVGHFTTSGPIRCFSPTNCEIQNGRMVHENACHRRMSLAVNTAFHERKLSKIGHLEDRERDTRVILKRKQWNKVWWREVQDRIQWWVLVLEMLNLRVLLSASYFISIRIYLELSVDTKITSPCAIFPALQ